MRPKWRSTFALEIGHIKKGDGNSLILERDLSTFTNTYIVPYLTKRRDFAVLIQSKKVPGLELEEVCDQYIDTLIEALNDSPSEMIGNPGQYEPEVDVIEIPGEFRVLEASEVSENLLLVVFEFDAQVYFTYFLSHSEYATLSEEEWANISVLEPNWNEYVMQVETGRIVQFKCRLTFNAAEQEVESFEVDQVEGVLEYS